MSKVFVSLAVSVDEYITYDDSGWSTGGGPHPGAPLIVLSHRPARAIHERQTFVSTGSKDSR